MILTNIQNTVFFLYSGCVGYQDSRKLYLPTAGSHLTTGVIISATGHVTLINA